MLRKLYLSPPDNLPTCLGFGGDHAAHSVPDLSAPKPDVRRSVRQLRSIAARLFDVFWHGPVCFLSRHGAKRRDEQHCSDGLRVVWGNRHLLIL